VATILVVDDEPDLRDLLAVNLGLDGHVVQTAPDGEEALTAMRGDPPDLVVLDVMMPRRDGWAVLEAIKAPGTWSQVPVLMLTARAAQLDRLRGGVEGAVRYLTKPFSLIDLRAAIRQALSGEPERLQRRAAQQSALVELARLEGPPRPAFEPPPARPHLTRLDGAVSGARARVVERSSFSFAQCATIDAVTATPTLRAAAESLGVSRSYLYAHLRRIADKIGIGTGPELGRLLRSGAVTAR